MWAPEPKKAFAAKVIFLDVQQRCKFAVSGVLGWFPRVHMFPFLPGTGFQRGQPRRGGSLGGGDERRGAVASFSSNRLMLLSCVILNTSVFALCAAIFAVYSKRPGNRRRQLP